MIAGRTIPVIFRFGLGTLILIAIGWQLSIHLRLGFNPVNFFSYFTNLTNLFTAGVLLAGGFRLLSSAPPSAAHDLLRGLAVVYMTIVGIVFTALLRENDLGSLLPWINALLHYVVPVVTLLEWFVYPPRHPLTMRQVALAPVPPLVYLAYVLLRGSAIGWYPYPFLNPGIAGGYGAVAMSVVAIIVVFFIAGWAISALQFRRATS